ncbi:MAG: hypothetical protein KDK39_12165, partial [Leptospiraceae bacterium]|nr:hypothetical protein [Leptospiraceae bacterium]
MSVLESKINSASREFEQNSAHHQARIDQIRNLASQIQAGGGDRARALHEERGKLFVRDRIRLLLDLDSPFLEIGLFAAQAVYEFDAPSAGIVCGIGFVHGRLVMIVANDATVKGGTYTPLTVKKHLRAQEIATENRLPCIYLVDSGGAFLPMQDQVFPDREHFGRIFFNQAQMSALKIPQIAVVMGSCTAGGAYIPAMSEQTVIVRGHGTIFLGGPPLVKAATGEEVTPNELGGAEVHATASGVADYYAESDQDALQITRQIVRDLAGETPASDWSALEYAEPRYSAADIPGILQQDTRAYYDAREIISRIIDGSEWHEFKQRYATTLITGFARIYGQQIGIIANNGVLFSESALKGAHFIELCCQR